MKTYGDQFAHPHTYEEEYGDRGQSVTKIHNGLTKREYFAAMAMQGLCVYGAEDAIKDAKTAIDMADALIQALNL